MMNASSLDPRTMRVIETPISPFLQNAPILACEETSEAILVDPGDEVEKILDVAKTNNLNIKYIVLTHGHIDHAGGTKKIAQILNIDIIGPHKDDKFLLDSLELQGQMYGIAAQVFEPNRWLEHGDKLTFGNHHQGLISYFLLNPANLDGSLWVNQCALLNLEIAHHLQ